MPPPTPCPTLCADLGGNGKCDLAEGCNTTQCFWDFGDCRDLLESILLQQSGTGSLVSALSQTEAIARLGEVVATQGGFVKQALYLGIFVGLCGTISAVVFVCNVRRRAQQRALVAQTAKGGAYTPYGQAPQDILDSISAPRLTSAIDGDDDNDDVDLEQRY